MAFYSYYSTTMSAQHSAHISGAIESTLVLIYFLNRTFIELCTQIISKENVQNTKIKFCAAA
jgi:hypothetical protein